MAAERCPVSGSQGAGGCPFADIIKATAPVVAPKVRNIVDDFYPRMFKQNPETKAFFNPANQFAQPPVQRMALANAVVAYASNIDDLTPLKEAVEVICQKHAALNVQAPHYGIVHKNLMESIGAVLGEAVTPEVGAGWSEAVLALAKVLTEREDQLYREAETRPGGWRGIRDFRVSEKREVATGCMAFTFEPVDGSGPIGFSPGQFLTVHLKKEGATPRHYSITSGTAEPLQCCVKRVEGGFVSSALHEIAEGEVVGLSPPFGHFGFGAGPAVLISAGIGITPMRSMVKCNPGQVKLAVHIDRNATSHPFKEEFAGVTSHVHYTQDAGRPTAQALVDGVLKEHLKDCDFYLCGPPMFLGQLKNALSDAGAKSVHTDTFGPTLA